MLDGFARVARAGHDEWRRPSSRFRHGEAAQPPRTPSLRGGPAAEAIQPSRQVFRAWMASRGLAMMGQYRGSPL